MLKCDVIPHSAHVTCFFSVKYISSDFVVIGKENVKLAVGMSNAIIARLPCLKKKTTLVKMGDLTLCNAFRKCM